MVLRSNVSLFSIMLCFGFIFLVATNVGSAENSEPESQHTKTTVGQVVESVDKIAIKQTEMRNTIVLVQTRRGNGSGTIIDRLDTDEKDKYEYRVLTNAHVTHQRFITQLLGVDSLTGKIKIKTVDTGCRIISFNYEERDWEKHTAKVMSESVERDFALLSFISQEKLTVARVPTPDMLKQVRVFDEVFAIGCQLGRGPIPTFGIISQILGVENKEEEGWLIYGITAQIAPGSSGGGLFREYDGHYYLIGIPFRVEMAPNGQVISHLAQAISIATALDFIDKNAVNIP